ncbi:MAG: hypothetical protein OET16_12675, partial [Chromatiales bacterium]|nr:hypothetical protein [Chromatiales bacterium]
EQSAENRRVVNAFKHAEEAGIVSVALQVKLVDLGADSPHTFGVAQRHPCMPLQMIKNGILRGKMLFTLDK